MNKIELVKELRHRTDCGLLDAVRAAEESNLNLETALEILYRKHQYKDRGEVVTKEGRIASMISEDGKKAVILELKCQTDFAANTYEFGVLASRLAKIALGTPEINILEDLYANAMVISLLNQSQNVLKEHVTINRLIKWEVGE